MQLVCRLLVIIRSLVCYFDSESVNVFPRATEPVAILKLRYGSEDIDLHNAVHTISTVE